MAVVVRYATRIRRATGGLVLHRSSKFSDWSHSIYWLEPPYLLSRHSDYWLVISFIELSPFVYWHESFNVLTWVNSINWVESFCLLTRVTLFIHASHPFYCHNPSEKVCWATVVIVSYPTTTSYDKPNLTRQPKVCQSTSFSFKPIQGFLYVELCGRWTVQIMILSMSSSHRELKSRLIALILKLLH